MPVPAASIVAGPTSRSRGRRAPRRVAHLGGVVAVERVEGAGADHRHVAQRSPKVGVGVEGDGGAGRASGRDPSQLAARRCSSPPGSPPRTIPGAVDDSERGPIGEEVADQHVRGGRRPLVDHVEPVGDRLPRHHRVGERRLDDLEVGFHGHLHRCRGEAWLRDWGRRSVIRRWAVLASSPGRGPWTGPPSPPGSARRPAPASQPGRSGCRRPLRR